ncbi:MAG: hypothetical protein GX601_03070 [Anaerolineales bacterium]|nr:hypothetical protein [Anaerolineales bacterium]
MGETNSNHNILVVSDLHLSEGYDASTGRFSRLEDFFLDDAFARFLQYHEEIRTQPPFSGRPWMLVINGDALDLLQVISLPAEGRLLRCVAGVERYDELPPSDHTYGLAPTRRASEWRIRLMARGHQQFLAALGRFIAHGNEVAFIKGNHDVDLHWPTVCDRLTREIGRAYTRARLRTGVGEPLPPQALRERVHYYPWFYYEPGRVYIEHGGQYEASTHFRDFLDPVQRDDPQQLDLPWGSLFVTYLFNQIEDVHPFADNIKPVTRYLWWAIRTDLVSTAELLATRGWVFLRAFWNVGQRTAESALEDARRSDRSEPQHDPLPLPTDVTDEITALGNHWAKTTGRSLLWSVLRGALSLVTAALAFLFCVLMIWHLLSGPLWLAGLYLLALGATVTVRHQLGQRFERLEGADYLTRAASELERILAPAHTVHCIVLGHSHGATLQRLKRAWYVNVGAWVPFVKREGPIEGEEQLTFLRLAWNERSTPELLRWDDNAGIPRRLVLRADGRK